MSLDLETLDLFSQAFAKRFFTLYPDWQPHARLPEEGQPPYPLAISFRSPAGHPFWIDTANSEVLLAFSTWHGHFVPKPESGWEECIDEALEWVDAIVKERVFAYLNFFQGRPGGGSLIFIDEDWSDLQPTEERGTHLASWRGTYDLRLGNVPPEVPVCPTWM